jgi:microcystin-dependent protein
MTQPTKPTVPDAPLRSQPSTFSARIEDSLVFWPTFATYLDEIGTYTKTQADAALAAATAGDLPPITGQTLNYIRVNAGETGVEFLTPAQVLTAIGAEPALPDGATMPTGTVINVAMNTAPAGYLKANGAAVSRTTYAALFSAIGSTFGVGDGSTTFNVPDLRGEFVRGWVDDGSVDSGRVFGSAQSSANKDHYHLLLRDVFGASTGGDWDGATTDHIASGGSTGDSAYRLRATSSEPNVAASSSQGETESRPRNIALLACIKT